MVVRIHNLSKWQCLPAGQGFTFPGDHARRIRIDLNCPEPTRLDVEENGILTFLAVIQGFETVEFGVGDGQAKLVPSSDGEVWYFTNDGDAVAVEAVGAVSFTNIASRRARNPELEHMMFKMEQNMMRRQDALFAELQTMQAATPHDPETGEVIDEVSPDANNGAAITAAGDDGGDTEQAPAGQVAGGKPGA